MQTARLSHGARRLFSRGTSRRTRQTICNFAKYSSDGSSGVPGAPQKAWLGSAVAIKDPTAATFGRHAGSNLLVVGAWEESALGVLTNAVLALVAQNVA